MSSSHVIEAALDCPARRRFGHALPRADRVATERSAIVAPRRRAVFDDPHHDATGGEADRTLTFLGGFQWLRTSRTEHETDLGEFARQAPQPQGEHSGRGGSAGRRMGLLMSALVKSGTPWAGHRASCGSTVSPHNEAAASVACAA